MIELEIAGRKIGGEHPTYFIVDIGANHDGDLSRAKDLIYLAADAGADAAKFLGSAFVIEIRCLYERIIPLSQRMAHWRRPGNSSNYSRPSGVLNV